MFYAAKNLMVQTVEPTVPWEYQMVDPGAQIRHDKQSRQDWYQSTDTNHNFYTGIEGINPNQRISDNNPAHTVSAFVVDFDAEIPQARVKEVVDAMKIKPRWIERSLGNNVRLVFTLPFALPVGGNEFCVFLLQQAVEWLQLGMLPALDEPAFCNPNKLYCNGGAWEETGYGDIPEAKLQSFFVKCGVKYRFTSGLDVHIPLPKIEEALRAKYKNFEWPGPFDVETQGPSFWVEGSESPLSAVVKPDGLFTFAAHASKPFFSWAELVGAEFVRNYSEDAMLKATKDIYFDDKRCWRKVRNSRTGKWEFKPCEWPEMDNYFTVNCGFSANKGKDGSPSMLQVAKNHIWNDCRIDGAAPFIYRPQGLTDYNKKTYLNTCTVEVVKATADLTVWGPSGKMPFLSAYLDTRFDPKHQKEIFLAWWGYFYRSGWEQKPRPGQCVFLSGVPGTGKTLLNRHIVGELAGGIVDASGYLIKGEDFTAHLTEAPLWCLDDDSTSVNAQTIQRCNLMIKKVVANKDILHNKKYLSQQMTEWMGRVFCTLNTDFVSLRSLALEPATLDKINVFRFDKDAPKDIFFERYAMAAQIEKELPYMGRYLLEYVAPDWVKRDTRYGFAAYQETSLLELSQQGGRSAPFRELLEEAVRQWFADHKDKDILIGSLNQLVRLIGANPANEILMRGMKLEQMAHYMEMIQREGLFRCEVDESSKSTRKWKFYRDENTSSAPSPDFPAQSDQYDAPRPTT